MKRIWLPIRILAILVLLLGIGFGAYLYVRTTYRVENVYVEGNVHYTSDEIKDMVLTGPFKDNSLFLSHQYKHKKIDNVPFVEMMEVDVISKDTIKIVVYEKTLAGYVEYLGNYVYFDKDGIAVEVSSMKTEGIPEVIGVSFDYIILHEKLPVKDPTIFKKVLNITQLLTKYKVKSDKVFFKDDDEIVLYCNDISVYLGKEENLDIKVMNLPTILEKLSGETGILHMEDYEEIHGKATFEPK